MRYLTTDECRQFGPPGTQNECTPNEIRGGKVHSAFIYTRHASGNRTAHLVKHGDAIYGRLVEAADKR